MNAIALTGHPGAQQAVELQLLALINGRVLDRPILVRAGVTQSAEAHSIHVEGGEIWHCGTSGPLPALVGLIDRSLNAFQAKTRIAA